MPVAFDPCLQGLLTSDGRSIPLRRQSSDVLRLLIANTGRIVSKQEIIDDVWSGKAVTDDSVYQCIAEIRRAVGDDSGLRVITRSGRGYLVEGTPHACPSPISTMPLTISDAEPIRFVRSRDGSRIAWTSSGGGIPVLKAPNWITHLGTERRSSLYGPFYERLGQTARVVRYDQRGNGMSSWHVPLLSIEAMCDDILAVADAAGLKRFFLLGLSQGVPFGIAFAARHPERVIGIVGRGGYALGDLASGAEQNRQTYEGAVRMAELGWNSDDPTFRRYFTSRIMPDAPPEMMREMDEQQRISVPKENLRDFLDFDAHLDVTAEARRLTCPVLLFHARGDRMVPFADGAFLSGLIPNCRFVPIEGANHTLVPGTPAFETVIPEIEAFLRIHADD